MSNNKISQAIRKTNWQIVIGLVIILIALFLLFLLIGLFSSALNNLWEGFRTLDKTIAAAIVAGVFTVFVTTLTMFVGRYYEEKRKRTELHRDKKIQMYDDFIGRIFKLFAPGRLEEAMDEQLELVEFLREHQRLFLLWSDAGVIKAFADWQKNMDGEHNAKTILSMEKFFLAVRKDLGHSNWGIRKGDTIRYILKNTDFFLEQIKENPNITLAELSDLEKKAGL